MPYLYPLTVGPLTLVEANYRYDFRKKEPATLELGVEQFLRDYFRAAKAADLKSFDESILKFHLDANPPTIHFHNPQNNKEHVFKLQTAAIQPGDVSEKLIDDRPTLSSPSPIIMTAEQIAAWQQKFPPNSEFSIGQLKKITDIKIANDLFKKLAQAFVMNLMEKNELEALCFYAHQGGLLSSVAFFTEMKEGRPHYFFHNKHQTIATGAHYTLQIQGVMRKQSGSGDDIPVCKVIIRADVDRNTKHLVAAPEIILEFADSYKPKQIQAIVDEFIRASASNRKTNIREGMLDIGYVVSKRSKNQKLVIKLLISLCIFLLLATMVCTILTAITVLPALPFLSAVSIGALTLSPVALSALIIATFGSVLCLSSIKITSLVRESFIKKVDAASVQSADSEQDSHSDATSEMVAETQVEDSVSAEDIPDATAGFVPQQAGLSM